MDRVDYIDSGAFLCDFYFMRLQMFNQAMLFVMIMAVSDAGLEVGNEK